MCMAYDDEDYLMLSGIQHFTFCRRQWALIHIEQQWKENVHTIDGKIMHENAHKEYYVEVRDGTIITHSLGVRSSKLRLYGYCDVVEFRKSKDGVPIFGYESTYKAIPIEYKNGEPKPDDCDITQLVAQAICLEEMLCCKVPIGYIYYGKTKHRLKVEITDELRNEVESMALQMHQLYKAKHTPKVKRTKSCNACSLKNICLPVLCNTITVSQYIDDMLKEED